MSNIRPFLPRSIVLLVAGVTLAACSSGLQREPVNREVNPKKLDPTADSVFSSASINRPKTLALPPDLVSSEALGENITEAQTAQTVLPEVAQAKVVEQNAQRWLEVSADAQEVWDKLTRFWTDLDIELEEFDPATGLMATEWIDPDAISSDDESSPVNTFRYLVGQVIAAGSVYDRYRLRLERAGPGVTRVYASHEATRRIARQDTLRKIAQYHWVSEDENPEAVARLLQTLQQVFRH